MCTMDLSVNQEVLGVHQRYETGYGNHVLELQETYKETDITGNNNFFNSLKTETNSDHVDDSIPHFQDDSRDKKDFKVDNSLFSYLSFKKAMDLRIHNRTVDGGRRTIFEDAEYFARNCCYKLLPITFEQVDETIIHTEHNYSLRSIDSESEPEEDCSRTMDYSQIREKNYKKRKTKYKESSDQEETVTYENCQGDSSQVLAQPDADFTQQQQDQNMLSNSEHDSSFPGQPLDLSAASVVQEKKTEPLNSAPEENGQPDSDKENVSAALSGIRVTITGPDEKENYQPCDLFLNDIARLVPWLIDKDCFEIDILDRTCDRHDEFRKHRLYYVIAESTWRSFQSTNERVILTNDHNLGQPLRKVEKDERPSYLVFDQLSLAKCLAEYCQEMGGCFEYTCVEEEMNGKCLEEKSEVMGEAAKEEVVTNEVMEPKERKEKPPEGEEREVEGRNRRKVKEEEKRDLINEGVQEEEMNAVKEKKKEKEVTETGETVRDKAVRRVMDEAEESIREGGIAREEESGDENRVDMMKMSQKIKETVERAEEVTVDLKLPVDETQMVSFLDRADEAAHNSASTKLKKVSTKKGKRTQRRKRGKIKKKSPIQPESKNSRITTRSMSTSEFETSQKSDKRVNIKERRKRTDPSPPTQDPPSKRKRLLTKPQEVVRSKRAAVLPQKAEVKPERTSSRKRTDKKCNDSQRESGNKWSEDESRVKGRGNAQKNKRSLRSGATTTNGTVKLSLEKKKSTSSRKSRKR